MSDDDLRTALTKLADEHDAQTGPYAHILHTVEIRALLAAHPARPTLAHAYLNPINNEGSEVGCALWLTGGGVCGQARSAHPSAPSSDTRREDVARALARGDRREQDWEGYLSQADIAIAVTTAHAIAARLRGESRG